MKFAKVTYGTQGDTKQYTYVVDDNVNVGTVMYPSVRHYKPPHTIFSTTAIVQSTAKSTSAKGQEVKSELDQKGVSAVEVKRGTDLNVSTERTRQNGKFAGEGGVGKATKNSETGLYQAPKQTGLSEYAQITRQRNVEYRQSMEKYKNADGSYKNYKEYVSQFKGDN